MHCLKARVIMNVSFFSQLTKLKKKAFKILKRKMNCLIVEEICTTLDKSPINFSV